MQHLRRTAIIGGALVALTIAAGCGDGSAKRANITGTVTFDGKPVPKGRIYFDPVSSGNKAGLQGNAEIVDGKYDTNRAPGQGASPGTVEIRIVGIGEPTSGYPEGKPLFLNYVDKEKLEVPESGSVTRDITVPTAARAKVPDNPPPPP